MQFKEVKEVKAVEEKSTQEIEKELLDKHEQQFNDEQPKVEEAKVEGDSVTETPEHDNTSPELSEEDVLTYIGNRYGKEISSIDEFVAERESSEELPEDVAAYFRYRKETGRGMDDYIKLNKNYDDVDENELMMDYYRHTEEGLDDEDLTDLIESKFGYDEDYDDEALVKKQKLAKKRELVKAKKFFTEQQEQYKAPLESSSVSSSEVNEELQRYRQQAEEAKGVDEMNRERSDWFQKQTDKIFNDEFKGFEFNVNDRSMTFKPGEASELKSNQQTIVNFVSQFTDDKNFVKDAEGYHRALSVAMNPDKFAKFFYEQGKADAVDDVSRKSKNIDMDMRRTPETTTKSGFQVRSLNQDSGRGLKIRSAKRI